MIEAKLAFLVSGATGSAKTTLLAALLRLVPQQERTVVVEDSRELTPNHPNVVSIFLREQCWARLLEPARAWQISMVQGLRHHAAGARYVRQSERQVLARAVGVRIALPMMVVRPFVCIGLTRDLPHLSRGVPRGCSQPGAAPRVVADFRRVLDLRLRTSRP
jgi:hypothetical protein